jgi:hexosaminidase
LLVAVGMVTVLGPEAAAVSAAPLTVPAVRQWTPAAGEYTFRPGARVLSTDPALGGTAAVFAADLTAVTGVPVSAVTGTDPRPGDVELRLGGTTSGEGYEVAVGTAITIQAGAEPGVFHGTRSVLQWLRQGWTVGGGQVRDWPVHPERGLMVDLGRRYLPVSWLRDRIREMSYLKLNQLHLHLSDDIGFRLASDRHPEIVAEAHYTKREIRELVGYAARYHVEIIPEIDFPGHSRAVLAPHPELRLAGHSGLIDLSNPAAYEFMAEVITEYLPLFPGRYWHIGGDEYLADYGGYPQLTAYAKARYGPAATAKDTFLGYLNWANGIVRAAGRTARAWNDGLKPGGSTITVHPDIVIHHWSQSGLGGFPWYGPAYTASQLVAAGHRVHNSSFTPTYYTTGLLGQLLTAPPSALYEHWNPRVFVDGSTVEPSLGASVSVWFDGGAAQTDAQVTTAISDRLPVLSQQTWGSAKPARSYAEFRTLLTRIGTAS